MRRGVRAVHPSLRFLRRYEPDQVKGYDLSRHI